MHELSIMMNIVAAAEEQTLNHQSTSVENITLEIGELAGVDTHALEFVWDAAVKDTVLETAHHSILNTEGRAYCPACDVEFNLHELYDPCPICDGHTLEIIRGNELKIRSMTLLTP